MIHLGMLMNKNRINEEQVARLKEQIESQRKEISDLKEHNNRLRKELLRLPHCSER